MALSGWVSRHLTQCGQDRGLPPYQVASWSIQPFGHNRHRPKIGGCCALFGDSSSNTMWPGPRLTSVPSGILIHPAIWPQHTGWTVGGCCVPPPLEAGSHLTQCGWGQVSSWSTNVTDRQERQTGQRSDSIGRTVLQTVAQNRLYVFYLSRFDFKSLFCQRFSNVVRIARWK